MGTEPTKGHSPPAPAHQGHEVTLPNPSAYTENRPWETCEALVGVTREKAVERNLLFIDAKHHAVAFQKLKEMHPEIPKKDLPLYLHRFYLKEHCETGRFASDAWQNLNLAEDYVAFLAAQQNPLQLIQVLEINALIQHGSIPVDVFSVVRDASDVMGTTRPTEDLRRVFTPDGTYLSKMPQPPLEGFKGSNFFFTEHPSKHFQPGKQASIASILRKLDAGQISSEDLEAARLELEDRLTRDPHDIASKQSYVIFCTRKEALQLHLEEVCTYSRDMMEKLARIVVEKSPTSEEDKRELVRRVVSLAVHTGSVIDMGHFAMDGMGRTNLRVERLLMKMWGLEPPVDAIVKIGKRYFENGAYVSPKSTRIDAILKKIQLPSWEHLHEAAEGILKGVERFRKETT